VSALEGRAENFARVAVLKAFLDRPNDTLRFGDRHKFRERGIRTAFGCAVR